MIDTKKVRLMTKVAIYEKNDGVEDIRINKKNRATYVNLKMIETLICVTIAYFLLLALLSVHFIPLIITGEFSNWKMAVICIVAIYVLMIIFSMVFTYFFYKEKYRKMNRRIIRYDRYLSNLDKYITPDEENIQEYQKDGQE